MSVSQESGLVIGAIHLYSKIQRRVSGALSAHGIGVTEYLVLHQLSSAPGRKMRRMDLAGRLD